MYNLLSFWEKQSFIDYDVIVVGSGIVGLSAACSVKEKHPSRSVLVLERGIFPTGASTKNAGFACYGSAAEIWHDVQLLGLEKALEVVALRVTGLQKLRKRLGDNAIDYQEFGGGEIILTHQEFDVETLPKINSWLFPFFGKDVFVHNDAAAKGFGFQTSNIRHFILNTIEGQIDTGKMMKSLLAYAQQLGVTILTGCQVQPPEPGQGGWQISVDNQPLAFRAPQVMVCTNAFTPSLLPQLNIVPGRGQVLITKPIDNLKFKGIFHFDEGYWYFRNVGNRILFGGGRNMDFEGEATTEIDLNPAIQSQLEHYLSTLILPKGTPFEIDQRWAGIMAFGNEKVPIVKDLGHGLLVGCRMNGMGIAMGTEIGHRLAEMA